MKEKQLSQILTTVKSSSTLTEVANKLFLSQPYISETIHNAELKYKTVLIKRKPLPIELTEAGQLILASLNQIDEIKNKLEQDLLPYSNQKDTYIKIGFHQPWTITHGYDFMQKLQSYFPTINFEVSEITSDIGERILLNGDIDIFIGHEFYHSQLITNVIMNEPLSIIVPKSSKIYRSNFTSHYLSKDEISLFDELYFVKLTDDSFYQRMIDHMFTDNGIHTKTSMKFSSIIAAARAASKGMGVNVTITNLTKEFLNLNACNIYKIPNWLLKLDLGLSYRTNASKMVKSISEKLTQILKQYN